MATEQTEQTWIIRTTEQMDDADENDVIGTTVAEECLPHDLWLDVNDWRRADESVIDTERDANGRLRMVLLESFGTEYDRSAEVSFPVIWTRMIERIDPQ